ncbi:hypothetical protein P5705_00635 [Pseudomonas entomophila]|uniref:hypothetical protein n=1 Tax=Pseudomonas entomophila TaxID=312306 RepID=UPI002405C7D7|nr:hypothetical protein [Pseudomonas entomophila]MDF9616139.1 hypothetical protein [Pseudomonas entomophila]
MSTGLQVFDPQGKLNLDLNDRITRLVMVRDVKGSGSMVVPELAQGTPFAFAVSNTSSATESGFAIVNVSGTTVTWSAMGNETLTLICAVY